MPVKIASIVEGEGEIESVPILLRRVLQEEDGNFWADVKRPIRQSRNKLVQPGELERAVQLAALDVQRSGCILVILDSDDDPPCVLGPLLLKRAVSAAMGLPVRVTLAHREWECWYLAAASSLAGKRGLVTNLTAPDSPETIRGAKEWLASNMVEGRTYRAAIDQPSLANSFSLEEAMACPSFARFRREVVGLFVDGRKRWP